MASEEGTAEAVVEVAVGESKVVGQVVFPVAAMADSREWLGDPLVVEEEGSKAASRLPHRLIPEWPGMEIRSHHHHHHRPMPGLHETQGHLCLLIFWHRLACEDLGTLGLASKHDTRFTGNPCRCHECTNVVAHAHELCKGVHLIAEQTEAGGSRGPWRE